MRPSDPLEARARELAMAAGVEPDSRIPNPAKPDKTMPAWTGFRDAARAAKQADAQARVAAILGEQPGAYRDAKLTVFGEHEASTIEQMRNCMKVGAVVGGTLCADGHLGYAQPVGGVIAYEGQVSISGVGFDIGCGNMAVRLDTPYAAVKERVPEILGDIRRAISFGVGRVNAERVEHALLDDREAWAASGMEDYTNRRKA
jgi:tRNA-splicing ligase RtcB